MARAGDSPLQPPPSQGPADAARQVERWLGRRRKRWVVPLVATGFLASAILLFLTWNQVRAMLHFGPDRVVWRLSRNDWLKGGTTIVDLSSHDGEPPFLGIAADPAAEIALLPRLHHVVELDLTYAIWLPDAALAVLGSLPELRTLRLGSLPSLAGRDESRPARTGECVTRIARLRHLEDLDVAQTQWSDQDVARLAQLPRLRHLDLSGTRITDAVVPLLVGMPALESVSVEQTALSAAAIRALSQARPDLLIRQDLELQSD